MLIIGLIANRLSLHATKTNYIIFQTFGSKPRPKDMSLKLEIFQFKKREMQKF